MGTYKSKPFLKDSHFTTIFILSLILALSPSSLSCTELPLHDHFSFSFMNLSSALPLWTLFCSITLVLIFSIIHHILYKNRDIIISGVTIFFSGIVPSSILPISIIYFSHRACDPSSLALSWSVAIFFSLLLLLSVYMVYRIFRSEAGAKLIMSLLTGVLLFIIPALLITFFSFTGALTHITDSEIKQIPFPFINSLLSLFLATIVLFDIRSRHCDYLTVSIAPASVSALAAQICLVTSHTPFDTFFIASIYLQTLFFIITLAGVIYDIVVSYFKEKRLLVSRLTQDLTEMEMLKETVKAAQEEAESATKSKSRFLANMSHEIRTPINPIIVLTENMIKNPHMEREGYLEIIHSAGKSLLDIVNDILDLAKIESGKLDVHEEEFDFTKFMRFLTIMFEGQTNEKGIILDLKVSEDIPRYVYGPEKRIGQVLRNLIGNAVKFTSQGGVYITVLKEIQDDGLWITFQVKDTGIGIPQEKLDTIFERFEQADGSITRKYGGTGLGLNISQQLLELMGSVLALESEEGAGSIFSFTLKMEEAEGTGIEETRQDNEIAKQLPSLKLLVADDQKYNQKVNEMLLSRMGHQFDMVENGLEAVKAFERVHYDSVLMDINMPDMDGYEATKKMREIEHSRGDKHLTPIIALTASVMNDEIDDLIKAGFDNILNKPIELNILIKVLCQHMERIEMRRTESGVFTRQVDHKSEKHKEEQQGAKFDQEERDYFDVSEIMEISDTREDQTELTAVIKDGIINNYEKLSNAIEINSTEQARLACHNLLGAAGSRAKLLHSTISEMQDMIKKRGLKEAKTLMTDIEAVYMETVLQMENFINSGK